MSNHVDQLLHHIAAARQLYYRLVLVIGPAGSGKTRTLQAAATVCQFPRLNLSLALAEHLLPLPATQRAVQAMRLLRDLVAGAGSEGVMLDNLELLFEPSLQLDPLRALQQLARQRTIAAAWNGAIEQGYLRYATPDHPEYRRYPLQDYLFVELC